MRIIQKALEKYLAHQKHLLCVNCYYFVRLNVYFIFVEWNVLQMSVRSSWLIALFKYSAYGWFLPPVMSVTKKGVLNSPNKIVEFLFLLSVLEIFAPCVLKLCY